MRWFTLNKLTFRLRYVATVSDVQPSHYVRQPDGNYLPTKSSLFVTMCHGNAEASIEGVYNTEEEAIAVRRSLLEALDADPDSGSDA